MTNLVYVANAASGNVTVIDGATNATTTVPAGTGPYSVAVNPVTNRIFVTNANSGNVTVIDGATNSTTTVPAGTNPLAIAVNPVTGTVYVGNFNGNNVTVITEQQVQAIPLTASITPLPGNLTFSATPTFTFGAQSTFSPTAPAPHGVFFQADTWQGPWTAATYGGASFSGALPSLRPGYHVLFAFADDGEDATSTQLDSPLIGSVTAYGFLVAAPATQFLVTAPASATAGSPIGVTVTALDANDSLVFYYPGTVRFSSSDGAAALPSETTLTNGTGTFLATLNTAGPQTVTATDAANSSINGTSGLVLVSPTPTPTPTPTPSPTPTPTPTRAPSPTPRPSPTPSPTASVTPTPTPTRAPTPPPRPTPTPTPSPTSAPSPTPSVTPTPTPTPSPTPTRAPTPPPRPTPTPTPA